MKYKRKSKKASVVEESTDCDLNHAHASGTCLQAHTDRHFGRHCTWYVRCQDKKETETLGKSEPWC